MVLIALMPLLTSTLTSTFTALVGETTAGVGKNTINKITKKLFEKELFKKKVRDLSVEDFIKKLNLLVPKGLDEFVKIAHEELKQVLPKISDIETILKTTIKQTTETISKLEAKNDAMLKLVKQTLMTKQKSLPDQYLDPDWYAELKSEIQYANQHNIQFVTTFQSQLANFQKNFQVILIKLSDISKTTTVIDKKVTEALLILQEEFKKQTITEKGLIQLAKLRIENYKDFASKEDIAFAPEKYSERTSNENVQTVKTVLDKFINQNFTRENQAKKRFFLLVGEAGMGKTWFLANFAIKYVQKDYPVFFITLRDGIEARLKQIFDINERNTANQILSDLQENLSRWLILIFDGFDEILEGADKQTLIHGYLRTLQHELKNTLIIISSRNADWFHNQETRNGNSEHIKNTLWDPAGNRYSYNLQQFSTKEQITVFRKYKSKSVPKLAKWEKEVREIALRPVWMRLICEIYEKGYIPSFSSIEIYSEYFNRVILTTKHIEVMGEVSKLLLVRGGNFSTEFSVRPTKFKDYRKEIHELHSKNILVESNPKGERYKFMTPHFGYYGIAYYFYQMLFDLNQEIENIQSNKKNALKLKKELDKILEQKARKIVYNLIFQLPKELGDDDINVKDELIKLEDTLSPEQITIKQLIDAIKIVEKAHASKNLKLLRIAKQLNVTVEELKTHLEIAIYKERIKGTIDDQETINENDDVLRLAENWNVVQIIQDKLNKAKILLQPKKIRNLDNVKKLLQELKVYTLQEEEINTKQQLLKEIDEITIQDKFSKVKALLQAKKIDNLDTAKKLLQELEVYKLQEEEINTKQQLLKEINEITIQDKFSKINNLLSNTTLQNLEQAREILQSLQHDNLSENHQITVQKLSEKIEAQATALKFEEISIYLANPTLNKLNQAHSKLLELKDSELAQEDRVTKQNLLQKISNEHGKIQAKNREISSAKQEIKQLAENGQRVNAKIQELKNKYKQHLTELDLEFLEKCKTEDYYGVSLQAKEKMVLSQLEQMCGKQIPLVDNVDWSTFGYSNTGTTITDLGLCNQKLSSLPESISSLKNLQELWLSSNQLSSLPESISSLQELRVLHLYNNQLSSLPESISSLKNLQELSLYNNQLSSLPESISSLQELRVLSLAGNALSSLPESISSLQELRTLYLGDNQLSSLPESISSLQELQYLSLRNNQLSSLPECISSLQELRMLSLADNALSSLPESISLLKNLRELWLSNNQLSSLPESISSLQELRVLNLRDNQLSSLPESISSLQELRKLYLHNNQLSSLPESISSLQELRVLHLRDNQLSSLPESISSLQELRELYLDDNALSSLPESISSLKNLRELWLFNNQLSSLPENVKDALRKLKSTGCSVSGVSL